MNERKLSFFFVYLFQNNTRSWKKARMWFCFWNKLFKFQVEILSIINWRFEERINLFRFRFQAYISCALGVHKVGYVMICFGVVNAGCSLLFGSLMKFVGRQPLMALGAIVHACLIVVLLLWKPHPDNPYVFYSVSGLWGVGDAVWQTQVNG